MSPSKASFPGKSSEEAVGGSERPDLAGRTRDAAQHSGMFTVSVCFAPSVFLDDFLATGRGEQVPQLEFEQLPFSHPLFIMFSSGTTGAPKCMVHSAGVRLSRRPNALLRAPGCRKRASGSAPQTTTPASLHPFPEDSSMWPLFGSGGSVEIWD